MALLGGAMPRLASTAGASGVDAQRMYLHPGQALAVPRHPGKYVVASSADTSSHSSDDEEGSGPQGSPDAEAAETPFSMGPQHQQQPMQRLQGSGDGGGGGGEGDGEGDGDGPPRSRAELMAEAPYPHRWPSRKRRKCRSLAYLAVHLPTVDDEQPGVRPSSQLPQDLAGGTSAGLAPASTARLPQPLAQAQAPAPHQPPPAPPAAAPYQPPPLPPAQPPRMAGAPRALSKPLQAAAGAGKPQPRAGGDAKRSSAGGSQPAAKKARVASAGGSGAGAAGTAAKPVSKPPFKPSSQSQAQPTQPGAPVRRPSSVTLDRQRNGSAPVTAAGSAALARAPSGVLPGGVAAGGPAAAAPAASPRDFPPGQLVWAKMPSYPWWPAQVQVPQANHIAIRHGASDVFVVFYGTADFTWVPVKDVKPFSHTLPDYTKHSAVRNKGLQRAIDEAWVALGRPRPDVQGKPHG